ncbi:ABC transporter permease [Telmatobacter bradus]|uniref:ABC transporter permease n=1 Tax=Telmatobacter bradus TaxID=474953 RepID=UPI003B4317AE
MFKFLLLAFRNLFRNRRRTGMTLLMVGGGVTGLLLVGGFFAFMYQGIREGEINRGLGHIQVFNSEHFTRDEVHVLDTGLQDWQQIAAQVRGQAHIRGVAPRIEFYGMLSNEEKTAVYMGSAVDPQAESNLGFKTDIVTGHDLSLSPHGETEAMVGAGLAKSLHVKPGDGLTIMAMTSDGALNGVDVNVVGIVQTGISEYDARYLRIRLADAQHLLQSQRITNLVIGLDRTENTDAVAAKLGPYLKSSQTLTLKKWIDLATYYKQVRSLFNSIYIFIGVIVFFMVLMSSINTLLMSMFERTREVGTMLAMGTPRSWIVALFVTEGTVLGVLGAVAGVLGGNLLAWVINISHVHLPPPPGSTENLPLVILHLPSLMVGASFLVVLSLALASILPAMRASKLQISEALSHV